MINLLSTEHKSNIRSARSNVLLSRYISIILLAIVFLLAVLYVSYTILEQTKASAESRVASNNLEVGEYGETKGQIDDLSARLNDAKLQLNQEVDYAAVLTAIGQSMPADTILENLKLDTAVFASPTPVEIIAYAKTEESTALIAPSLQKSMVFVSVTAGPPEQSTDVTGYPVKLTLSATFKQGGI